MTVLLFGLVGWAAVCWLVGRSRRVERELADVRTVAGDALVKVRVAEAAANNALEGWRGTLTTWRRFQGPGEAQFLAAAEAQFESSTPIGQAGDVE